MYKYKNKTTGATIEVESEIKAPHWEEVKNPEKKTSKKKEEK